MKKGHWSVLGTVLVLVLLAIAPGRVDAQTFGSNWHAEFFNNGNFSGAPQITDYPGGLNFNWPSQPTRADGTPVPGINPDNFSVRFTTSEFFATSGTYQFSGFADDQVTVFIDGVQVYNHTTPGSISFQRSIPAGSHSLQVDFIELTVTAIVQLQWQLVGGGGTFPGGTFFTPTPSGPAEPYGNVVFVRGLSLRTGPYLGGSFIGVLRPNNAYPVLARNQDEGGPYTWYKVIVGEKVGWSSGRYLTITGNVDAIPFESTVFERIDGAPNTGVIAVPRAVMNFRRRPSVRSQRIGQIPWGAETELLGRTIQGGRNHWFHVRYNGQVGWIYAPYVGWRGNIDAVPVH